MLDDHVHGTEKSSDHGQEKLDYDAIIIGAGISGLYQLHTLRELGLRVRVFETGTGVGGTWYWNRYPGARFDSESYSYAFSFSQELLDEWDWSEHFAPQPETERYLNYVADKFDLRRDIQFSAKVAAAQYDENARCWSVTLEDGSAYWTRYLITAVGPLSAPTLPRVEGIDDFKGQSFHTGLWPKEAVDFEGKRVAVIGTGATGVQVIQEVAKTAGHLTVFQRRPNWCKPLLNSKISADEMKTIRAGYPEMFKKCRDSAACFIHTIDRRSTFDLSEEERNAFWENQYATPGFGMWQGNFRDMLTDRAANKLVSDFVADKIRQRVNDPEVAKLLIPTDHGFGTRRVPQETHYYEVYNQPNVRLVSILETPIERITETGVKTSEESLEFDIIIYATGFDAITGSLDRIDIRGAGGSSLKEKWSGGPETFVGVMVDQFPNMFMVIGPHCALGNIPRTIEYNVEWVRDLIGYMTDNEFTFAEVSAKGVSDWMDYVRLKSEGLLTNEVDSWMTGVNQNVEGKQTRILARYSGTAPDYRVWCDDVASKGYPDVTFS